MKNAAASQRWPTEAAEDDWVADSGGGHQLSEEAFKKCWFQLADVHCDRIDAGEYADWIREVIMEMTMSTKAQESIDEFVTPDMIEEIEAWRWPCNFIFAEYLCAGTSFG